MRRVISMAGVAISLQADDADRWAAVDALFGRCPTVDADATITVRFGEEAPLAPVRRPDVAFSDVDLWFTDAGVVTRHVSGIVVGREADVVTAGGAAAGDELSRAFRRSAQHVLVDALADHGRFALHAAVLAHDGRAVLVLGDTGAGKSTLAVSALGLGWSVLADDIAWTFAGAGGTVMVAGFPKPLHIPPDIVTAVPRAADQLIGDTRGRFVVRDGLTTEDVAHRVRGVIVVRHSAADARLLTFASGTRLLTLAMRSYPLQASPARVRDFFPLAARISHVPVVLIEHAADPAVRAARAADLLGEAWTALVARDAGQ